MIKSYKELIKEGYTNNSIEKLLDEKKIYKIEKGIYSDKEKVSKLEIISKKYPNSIVTLESAFYLYGITKKEPEKISIATQHKTKVYQDEKIKQSFISDTIFNIGKTTIDYNDSVINIYDKEKLLIELIRNKDKLDIEYYNTVLNYYNLNYKDLNIQKIYRYLKNYKHREKIQETINDIIKNNIKYREVNMKGIVLAGGSGTRLYPITEGVSKQLLPIYDKPMIYYPISVLMLAGIKDILIITTEEDQPNFKKLLKDGSQFGINIEYIIQPSPDGLAQAFILGEEFIGDSPCAMVLGDNMFYGNGFVEMLQNATLNAEKGFATNFGVEVRDPERFGIMEIQDENGKIKIKSVEEKPKNPKSNFAITGLYFYPRGVAEKAKMVKPSARGELEITTLNDIYLQDDLLLGELLGGGFNWFDTGTFDSLYDAVSAIKSIQQNKGKVIACLEQISYNNGWITIEQLQQRAELLKKNSYGEYLSKIVEKENEKVLRKVLK